MLIPASFKTQRYPFIQFRLPEFPNEIRIVQETVQGGSSGNGQQTLQTKQQYRRSNVEYFNEKPNNKTQYYELTKFSRSDESSRGRKL